jgi:hypothetical protein
MRQFDLTSIIHVVSEKTSFYPGKKVNCFSDKKHESHGLRSSGNQRLAFDSIGSNQWLLAYTGIVQRQKNILSPGHPLPILDNSL